MTRVPWRRFETWLFPMTVVSFLGPSVQYVNQVFGHTQRWGVLALLLGYLLVRGRVASVFRGSLSAPLLLILGWASVSSLWSIVPSLSLAKSIAFWFVAVAMIGAGQYWVLRHGLARSLDYLLPTVLLAVFASALGPSLAPGGGNVYTGDSMLLYRGLVGNPNMLGTLLAMSVPPLLWRLHQETRTKWRRLWMLVLGVILVSLLFANSRSALLMTLSIGLGMVPNLDLRRRQIVVSVIALSALLVTMAVPSFWDVASERYIYKSSKQGKSVLYTREQVWEISKENALAGGWLGAGYGVTIGASGFAGGLTAVGYGREKGNTQMAIMEETGLVGLGLYAAFLIVLFRRMLRLFRRVGTRDERVLMGIVIGTLVGLTLQGIFEAWWVAPGSPEAAYWWAFVGVASGVSLALERRARKARWMA